MGAASDEPEGAVQEAVPPAGIGFMRRLKRLPVILGGVAALVGILCLVLWARGAVPGGWSWHKRTEQAAQAEKPSYVDIPDIIANLDTGGRRAVFVKLRARIEVAHASDQPMIVAEMPRILDTFQTYLRSMRPEEIHGGEGTYRLREALMNRIDIFVAPVEVEDVLFVEMLVQ